MNILYAVDNYAQVAKKVAGQIGASWQETYYQIPPQFGKGMIEAYTFDQVSAMIAIFKLTKEATVARERSKGAPRLLIDLIVSGFSPFAFEKQQDVRQLGFNVYLSTNKISDSSAVLSKDMQHEQICIAIDAGYVEKVLPPIYLKCIDKDFFLPLGMPNDLDALVSSLLISQNEESRLSNIEHNLSLLLEKLVALLKREKHQLEAIS